MVKVVGHAIANGGNGKTLTTALSGTLLVLIAVVMVPIDLLKMSPMVGMMKESLGKKAFFNSLI